MQSLNSVPFKNEERGEDSEVGKEAKRKKGKRAGGEKASGNTKYWPYRAPKCKLLVHEHFLLIVFGPNAAVKYSQQILTILETITFTVCIAIAIKVVRAEFKS